MTDPHEEDEQADPWSGMTSAYTLTEASITAIGKRCGAVHETGLNLEVRDGRRPAWFGGDPERGIEPCADLEYNCSLNKVGSVGDEIRLDRARIVVSGKHPNGTPVELRGKGWVGHDENGDIEVEFRKPPKLILPYGWNDDADENGKETDPTAARPVDVLQAALKRKIKASETTH